MSETICTICDKVIDMNALFCYVCDGADVSADHSPWDCIAQLKTTNKALLEACKRMVEFENIVIGTTGEVEKFAEIMNRVDETLRMGKAAIAEAKGNK